MVEVGLVFRFDFRDWIYFFVGWMFRVRLLSIVFGYFWGWEKERGRGRCGGSSGIGKVMSYYKGVCLISKWMIGIFCGFVFGLSVGDGIRRDGFLVILVRLDECG